MGSSDFIDMGTGVRKSRGRPKGPSARSCLKIYRVLSRGPISFSQAVKETQLARNTVGKTLRYLVSRDLVLRRRSGKRVLYEVRQDEVDRVPIRAITWAKLISRPGSKAERTRRNKFFQELLSLWWSPEAKELRSLNPQKFQVGLLGAISRLGPPFEIVKSMRGELDMEGYREGVINAILWDTQGKAYWSRTAVEDPQHNYQRPRRVQYVSKRTGRKRTRFVYDHP